MRQLFKCDQTGLRALSILPPRQAALVSTALNYWSLVSPRNILECHVHEGKAWQLPRLTSLDTIASDPDFEASPILTSVVARSIYDNSESDETEPDEASMSRDRLTCSILVPPENATPADIEQHEKNSLLIETYHAMESAHPVLLDEVREIQRRQRQRKWFVPVQPFEPFASHPYLAEAHGDYARLVKPRTVSRPPEKAVLIGMHWLQAGGAERWAIETVSLAKSKGFLPIVITDRESLQPWVTKDVLADALVLCLTFPMLEKPCDEPLLRSIFERFDVRGVLIHHCQWLYDRTYWIKHFYPKCPIVDTLHILEYNYAGGYPHEGVAHDATIDLHHVISPQLERWFVDSQGVDPERVVDAPLVQLTTTKAAASIKPRASSSTLTIAFVGRIARQKRPESFALLARKLARSPHSYKVIMHGTGELDIMLEKLISRLGIKDAIERRSEKVPVSETYRDADVLVVSSVNEGITLTTMEAISNGVPVISTDVGSQDTLVSNLALTRRKTSHFVKDAYALLERIHESEDLRQRIWTDEHRKLKEFSRLESASSLFSRLLSEWSQTA